jgi:hypothetical protein
LGKIAQIQGILGVVQDGIWGPKTQGALDALLKPEHPAADRHLVIASSFADPADLFAYQRALALGMSEKQALAFGDNGIGARELGGYPTVAGTGPACALPPEDIEEKWGIVEEGRDRRVKVSNRTSEVITTLKDKMPPRAHITTRARIDLNPDACAALGLTPPVMSPVVWSWV